MFSSYILSNEAFFFSERVGIFPEAHMDPVIQIANMVQRQGDKEPFVRNVFTLKACAPIVGSQVLCYEKEEKLLEVRC